MQLPKRSPSNTTAKKPLDELHDVLEKVRVRCGIPGMSVAVLYKGELIFAEGFGKRNEQESFTVETLSTIASVTKSFTATTIGELVAEGKVDWDKTPVSEYLPEFQLKDPILTSQLTFVDLLSHRTGLPDLYIRWYKNNVSRRELIKRLRHFDMSSKLGSKTIYNNDMYAVAGEAAANVAGIPYEDLVREKVLSPLGLTNTGFSAMEMRKRPNYTMPYKAASFEDAQKGLYKMIELDHVYAAIAPAGDMFSNVLDLVQWGRVVMNRGALNGKQILNKESIEETLKPYTIKDDMPRRPDLGPATTYGLGWWFDTYKGHVFYRHTGSVCRNCTSLTIYPHADLVIAQLFNIYPCELGPILDYHIVDELLNLPKTENWLLDVAVKETKMAYDTLASTLHGNLPQRVLNRPPTHPWQAYVGMYFNPVFGDISVRMERNIVTGEEALFFIYVSFDDQLVHYHYDAFVMTFDMNPEPSSSLATFQTGRDGMVAALTVEFYLQGPFEFKRKD
ncbi:hypothetical protein BGZ65_002883 [Modicella reniformis]|uniref:Beta-lactamase/transpeptidase-like protein n=1 Tax=Modicella reniformis TaxID=1440133 RepID=A0A9P6MKW4_9FUNG|nr:hypothetical protein BGZ65_002883 [Modicella reniformis]